MRQRQKANNAWIHRNQAYPEKWGETMSLKSEGDSLSTHSGAHFYTVDHPNQPKESKPEWIRSGGWWLNHIMTTSLNGLNILSTDKVQSMEGITWLTFGGFQNSLASTEIKVRPKKFKMHAKEKALSNV
ncbi:hypothetical protein AVEN_178763-1 [Araneus ventricosus]|uniref:Fibrinogen C-terminal domain-containing protein n=2 Tax=Araneus ventricosus TaxID=182803 RepID=A0A4Y2SMJ3_ARAVE|nr:hypothetical protein AVEN_178763-1 [Araneus ventricosus]